MIDTAGLRRFSAFFYVMMILVFSAVGLGAESAEDNLIKFHPCFHPAKISAGASSELDVDIDVESGYHAYVDMLKLQWISPEKAVASVIDVQPEFSFSDPFTHRERDVIEGHAQLRAKINFPENVAFTSGDAQFALAYQICSAKKCLFPKLAKLEAPLEITGVAGSGKTDESTPVQASAFERALAKGKFWAFIFVFIGGFLTSLTPCVFPMIPITISIIGAGSRQNKKSRAFALSLAYVLGIAFTYSSLGVLAATTGAVFGEALSNVYVATSVALIFFVMALSMFGLFEIQVPLFVRNRLGAASTGSGLSGAFIAGLFSGIVASPCIGPVLVAILTFVAKTAEVFFGFALLFTFATGMGILFIVLGTFTGLLARLPKSGSWMNATKYIFGSLLMAMSIYYILPVISAIRSPAVKPVENTNLPAGSKNQKGISWQNYSDAAVLEAKQSKKPVVIDFGADWCVACHELDMYTYADNQVIKESSRFLNIKVDATDLQGPVKILLVKYKVVGLPTVIFIDSSGKVRESLTVLGFVKAAEFAGILKKIN